jgi:hypothetical protein
MTPAEAREYADRLRDPELMAAAFAEVTEELDAPIDLETYLASMSELADRVEGAAANRAEEAA